MRVLEARAERREGSSPSPRTKGKNMNDIQQMCFDHFNEPVLMSFELARLIGYGADADDCYLIVKYPRRGRVWHTAVGGYMFLDRLKGQNLVNPKYPSYEGEVWDDFNRLDNMLKVNGVPKAAEFLVEIRAEPLIYTNNEEKT